MKLEQECKPFEEDIESVLYAEFIRQKYKKYKHKMPNLREDEVCRKVAKEWENMDLSEKSEIYEQYLQAGFIQGNQQTYERTDPEEDKEHFIKLEEQSVKQEESQTRTRKRGVKVDEIGVKVEEIGRGNEENSNHSINKRQKTKSKSKSKSKSRKKRSTRTQKATPSHKITQAVKSEASHEEQAQSLSKSFPSVILQEKIKPHLKIELQPNKSHKFFSNDDFFVLKDKVSHRPSPIADKQEAKIESEASLSPLKPTPNEQIKANENQPSKSIESDSDSYKSDSQAYESSSQSYKSVSLVKKEKETKTRSKRIFPIRQTKKISCRNESRALQEDNTPKKTSDYLEFYKTAYREMKERYPDFSGTEITKTLTAIWKEQKRMKQQQQEALEPPPTKKTLLDSYRFAVARRRFTKQKRKEGKDASTVASLWWHLPKESKLSWATDDDSQINDLLNESLNKSQPRSIIRYCQLPVPLNVPFSVPSKQASPQPAPLKDPYPQTSTFQLQCLLNKK